jgi:hypothetical protein
MVEYIRIYSKTSLENEKHKINVKKKKFSGECFSSLITFSSFQIFTKFNRIYLVLYFSVDLSRNNLAINEMFTFNCGLFFYNFIALVNDFNVGVFVYNFHFLSPRVEKNL